MTQWNLGIDMGSLNVRSVTQDGTVLAQSSAVSLRKGEAFAFGEEALRLAERTAFSMETGYPYENGALGNEQYFSLWMRRLLGQMPRGRARVLFACPSRMSLYEKRHTAALIMQSGAADCAFVSAETAALLGSGRDILSDECAMVCDIGAGHIACAAIAGGKILHGAQIPYGIREADRAIVRLCGDKHHMSVSLAQAEEVKKTLSSVKGLSMSVKGLSRVSGFPCECTVSSEDAAEAVAPIVKETLRLIRSALDTLSPECLEDLTLSGITLTGGGAQAAHLEEQTAAETHLPVQTASECENACVRGLHAILTDEKYLSLVQDYESVMKSE